MPDRLADGIAQRLARLRVVPAADLARTEAAQERARRRAAFVEWCRAEKYAPATVAAQLRRPLPPFGVAGTDAEGWARAAAWRWKHSAALLSVAEALPAIRYPLDDARRALAHAALHAPAAFLTPAWDEGIADTLSQRALTRTPTLVITTNTGAIRARWPDFGDV